MLRCRQFSTLQEQGMKIEDEDLRTFLRHLWGAKVIEINTNPGEGFKLKHHEKNPTAPLSPIRINMRMANNPTRPGPFLPVHVEMLGSLFWKYLRKCKLIVGGIAGIPHAASPFAKAVVEEAYHASACQISLLTLEKGGGLIKNDGLMRGISVLLLDDVVTEITSKKGPIETLRKEGYEVSDCLVFLDREQGGEAALKEQLGVTLHSVIKMTDMLDFFREQKLLPEKDHLAIQTYLEGEKARKAA